MSKEERRYLDSKKEYRRSNYIAPRSANTTADRSITPCESSAQVLLHGGLCIECNIIQKLHLITSTKQAP